MLTSINAQKQLQELFQGFDVRVGRFGNRWEASVKRKWTAETIGFDVSLEGLVQWVASRRDEILEQLQRKG